VSDDARLKRGLEMFDKVYGGLVPLPAPDQMDDFLTTMMSTVFADVWGRDGLSMRDRRLVVLALIAAMGEGELWDIQIRAAVRNGELTAAEVREMLIFLAPYIGFPRMNKLRPTAEKVLAELGA
jgi:4-carboxymuconolactone decarboxylase